MDPICIARELDIMNVRYLRKLKKLLDQRLRERRDA